MKKKWKLIGDYPVKKYQCGLVAGQKLRLRKDVVIQDTDGKRTGKVYRAGDIWTVIPGSAEPPLDVWLQRPDGGRHTWPDSPEIFEKFEKLS